MLGISAAALEDYETGRRRIAVGQLVAAAEALGVSISLLFYEHDQHGARPAGEEAEAAPWLAVSRPLGMLARPSFSRLRPLVELWRERRGRLPDESDAAVARMGLLHRMVFVRRAPNGARLVFAHFGAGIEILLPCESLLMIGRDIDDVHDRDYGACAARGYDESIASDAPRLQAIRATVRLSATAAIEGRYDRLLLPWIGSGGERFVMGVTLTREHRRVGEGALPAAKPHSAAD